MRDTVAALLYRVGLTRPERSAPDRLTIATLHRVLPEEAIRDYPLPQIAVSVAELEWLAAFFLAHFTCDTLSGAHRRWSAGERPARPFLALTFDDGQADNARHAAPVLARAGLPATFFVPVEAVSRDEPLWHDRLAFAALRLLERDASGTRRLLASAGAAVDDGPPPRAAAQAVARSKRLGEPERRALVERLEVAAGGVVRPPWDGMMRWDEVRALAAAGNEIGSHSVTHPLLPGLDDADLRREVAGSRVRIEEEIRAPCAAFCYPNGDCDPRVVGAVRDAGYRLAVVTAWGPNRPGADPLRLTRCDLQGGTSRDAAGRLSAPRLALRLSPVFARWRG